MTLTLKGKADETSRFYEIFDKFFDCLNVRSPSAGKLSRNPFKDPYRSPTDFWLKVHVYNIQCGTCINYSYMYTCTCLNTVAEGNLPGLS